MIITPEKAQFLMAALDTHVKEKGLVVAGMAAVLVAEIQADLNETRQSAQVADAAEDAQGKGKPKKD